MNYRKEQDIYVEAHGTLINYISLGSFNAYLETANILIYADNS